MNMRKRGPRRTALMLAVLTTLSVGALAVPPAGAGPASGSAATAESVTAESATAQSICRYRVTTTTPRYLLSSSNAAQGYFGKGTHVNAYPGSYRDGRLATTHTFQDKYGPQPFWVNASHVVHTGDACWA